MNDQYGIYTDQIINQFLHTFEKFWVLILTKHHNQYHILVEERIDPGHKIIGFLVLVMPTHCDPIEIKGAVAIFQLPSILVLFPTSCMVGGQVSLHICSNQRLLVLTHLICCREILEITMVLSVACMLKNVHTGEVWGSG